MNKIQFFEVVLKWQISGQLCQFCYVCDGLRISPFQGMFLYFSTLSEVCFSLNKNALIMAVLKRVVEYGLPCVLRTFLYTFPPTCFTDRHV